MSNVIIGLVVLGVYGMAFVALLAVIETFLNWKDRDRR